MSSSLQFIVAILVVLVLWMAYSLRNENWKEYFSSKDGKGILKGIVMVVALAVIVALVSGCSGTYLNDASVFVGLDYTKKDSPVCDTGPDDNTTSNLGARVNLFQSDDKKFRANAKYTHHSCAFSSDRGSYDAPGIEFEYQVWSL